MGGTCMISPRNPANAASVSLRVKTGGAALRAMTSPSASPVSVRTPAWHRAW